MRTVACLFAHLVVGTYASLAMKLAVGAGSSFHLPINTAVSRVLCA